MTYKPRYLSVSQHNTYERCAYRYRLARVEKVWARPASWLSQGLAVHKAMEEWEQSGRTLSYEDLIPIYQEEYARSIAEQAEVTPNFQYWFGSGPYNGKQDIERRYGVGLDQLKGLVEYVSNHDETIWTTPDGKPAIELEFNVEMGGVKVKGFIDQIIKLPDGKLRVRDIKTGAKPGDIFQLAVYAEAMNIMYGVDINQGDFLMGKTKKPTRPILISEHDKKEVHGAFKRLEDNIINQRFDPNPSVDACTMCDVKSSCEYAIA